MQPAVVEAFNLLLQSKDWSRGTNYLKQALASASFLEVISRMFVKAWKPVVGAYVPRVLARDY